MNLQAEQRLYGEDIYPYLQRHIPKNADVLEVGCGEGGLLEVFHAHGHRVVAWKSVKIGRKRRKHR